MLRINPNLSEICGIHTGDGYLRKRKNKIELDITGSTEEREYYDNYVIPLVNELFELNLVGRIYSKGTYGFVTTNSKFRIFNDLGFPYGKKSLRVRVPEEIFFSKDKLIYSSFLRGLFDTDGHLGFRKYYGNYKLFKKNNHHYPFVVLTTVSKRLAIEIKSMLGFLKIESFIYLYKPKNKRDNISYRIIINGISRVNNWMKIIGSKNSVKFSRYLVWKRFGFCPTNLTLQQRKDILKGDLDINSIGP